MISSKKCILLWHGVLFLQRDVIYKLGNLKSCKVEGYMIRFSTYCISGLAKMIAVESKVIK